MIVPTVQKAKDHLDMLVKLQRAKDESVNMSDTLQQLRAVRASAQALRSSYDAVKNRLHADTRADLSSQMSAIASYVTISHADFRAMRRQVAQLQQIGQNINRVEAVLLQHWATYAAAQTERVFGILDLVKTFPELQSRLDSLSRDQASLITMRQSLPSPSTLADFDAKLSRLKDAIATLEGLDQQVLAFLRKVAAGDATVADLELEVLEWLRQADRAKVFRITLGS